MKTHTKLSLKIIVGSFILLGIISSLGHYFAPRPSAEMFAQQYIPPGPEWFLQQLPRYDTVPISTALHVVPAALFFVLLALQLPTSLRQRYPRLHHLNGRLIMILGILIGLSGLSLGILIPFGGNLETFTTLISSLVFLLCIYQGYRTARAKNFVAHRQWMIALVALSFAPLTMRLIMTIFGPLQLFEMQTMFGPLMIISSVINLALATPLIRTKTQSNTIEHSSSAATNKLSSTP